MPKTKLTYEDCQKITNYLMSRAGKDFGKGIGIVITDSAGKVISASLMDGAHQRALQVSMNKAYTAARFEKSTQAFTAHIRSKGFVMADFCDPMLSPLNGGAPILNEEGTVIGAVGVSGLKGEEDQIIVDECTNLLNQ